ncbi:MAG: hypothetical protein IKO27_07955 [Ruminococcus sp.]|nr:hypothetical protein [Ruminococcus sp.]
MKTIAAAVLAGLMLTACGSADESSTAAPASDSKAAAPVSAKGQENEGSEASVSEAEEESVPEEPEVELKEGRYPVVDGKVQVWLPTLVADVNGDAVKAMEYDDKGQITKLTEYDRDNRSFYFFYDSDYVLGKVTNEKGSELTNDFNVSHVNDIGSPSSYEGYDSTYNIYYNEKGLVSGYDQSGSQVTIEYNDNDQPVMIDYNDDYSKLEFTYNSNGKLAKVKGVLADPVSYTLEYDEKGNMVKYDGMTVIYQQYEINESYWEFYRDKLLYNIIDPSFDRSHNKSSYISYINDGCFQNFLLHKLTEGDFF